MSQGGPPRLHRKALSTEFVSSAVRELVHGIQMVTLSDLEHAAESAAENLADRLKEWAPTAKATPLFEGPWPLQRSSFYTGGVGPTRQVSGISQSAWEA
jgi:hypothetical protein